MFKVGDRVRHFKSTGVYRIVSMFTWEATKEDAVLYENEATGERWGRTLKVFLEDVASPQDPTKTVKRFEPITTPDTGEFRIYRIEPSTDDKGNMVFNVFSAMGEQVATLKNGVAPMIALTFMNMSGQSAQRGDDYMAGVIQGCTHMTLLGNTSTPGSQKPSTTPESTKPSQSNSQPKSSG